MNISNKIYNEIKTHIPTIPTELYYEISIIGLENEGEYEPVLNNELKYLSNDLDNLLNTIKNNEFDYVYLQI